MGIVNGLPTYRKWGGPGWSAGEEVNGPLTPEQKAIPAEDPLDALFKAHDLLYDAADKEIDPAIQRQAYLEADVALWVGMIKMDAYDLGQSGIDGIAYRQLALSAFEAKMTYDVETLLVAKLAMLKLTWDGAQLFPKYYNPRMPGYYKWKEQLKLPSSPIIYKDPLALDLNADGLITTTAASTNGLHFDHDANGFAESTGWVSPQDGLLAWDRNNNGTIDSGNELFGDQTILRSGAKAASGLQALAEWDTDKNGLIDSSDTHFTDLRVWRDLNQDGVSQSGELQTLNDAGIASISLTGTVIINAPADANGNTVARTSTYTRSDGTTGASAEINLHRDTALSIPTSSYTVPDTIAELPDLSGYGNLLDLHQALAKEVSAGGATPLTDALNQYLAEVGAGDTPIRDLALDNLLYTWANAQNINPTSRGSSMDARQITFLETLFAQSLGNPDSNAAIQWRMSWQDIREYYGASLLAQTTLKPLFDAIQYAWDDASQTLKADLTNVTTLLQDSLAADPAQGTAQLTDFARAIKGLGAQDSVNYLALRETFMEQDQQNGTELAWAMDSAGMKVYDHRGQGSRGLTPHIEGTDTADAVRGSLTEGDGYLNGLYGSDTIWGTNRYETLINEAGDSLLHGGGGDDRLWAGAGADTLDGGTGNDTLQGEAGNDTYVFRKGSGIDRVKGWNAGDRVWLAANADQATFKRSRNDLIVGFADTPDKLIVENWYLAAPNASPVIAFRDGATLDATGISTWLATPTLAGQGTDVIDGSAADETLMGYAGDDSIAGNAGNDWLYGRAARTEQRCDCENTEWRAAA